MEVMSGHKKGRKLEIGTEEEKKGKNSYWFVPYGLLPLLSYSTQDHVTMDDTTQNVDGL